MLDAFDYLLSSVGYKQARLELLADISGTTKSAFLSRFGSKKNALLILFERYCSDASQKMSEIYHKIPDFKSAQHALYEFSVILEELQTQHLGSNRGMHEIFVETHKVDERTQEIFLQLVDLMKSVQSHHLKGYPCTNIGAFSASQMLVTINYNYVLEAMPALPHEPSIRHDMIAKMLTEPLKI